MRQSINKSFQVLSFSFVVFIKGKLAKEILLFNTPFVWFDKGSMIKYSATWLAVQDTSLDFLYSSVFWVLEVCPTWKRFQFLSSMFTPLVSWSYSVSFFFFFSPKILFHYAHTFPGFLPKLVAWIKICTYSSLVFFKNWGTLWFAALKKHGRNKYSECTRLRRYFYKEVALGLTVGTSENSWGKSLFLLINWKQQEVRNSCAFWCFSK